MQIKLALLLFLVILSPHAIAAEWAKVSVPKAIVYSDAEMKNAIGYVRQGAVIRVGENVRGAREALPFLFHNRVVYIAASDTSAVTSNETHQVNTNKEIALSKDFRGRYSSSLWLGPSVSQMELTADNISESYAFYGVSVGVRLDTASSYFWQFSLDRSMTQGEHLEIDLWQLSLGYGWKFINRGSWAGALSLNTSYIPDVKLKSEGQETTLSGQGLGAFAELDIGYQLSSVWALSFRPSFGVSQHRGFGRDETGQSLTPALSGPSFKAAISYTF